LLPSETKSRKARAKIAPRWRAIFVAAGLLGAGIFAAAKMESVAASTKANSANSDTAKTDNAKSDNAKTDTAKADGAKARPTDADAARESSPRNTDAAAPDQATGDAVGTIEGDAIALQGPMSVEVVHGQVKTMLHSGNDIRVKSGQARIDLVEGGKIAICGPAHFSVLKSGGSLTLALDSGVVHIHIDKAPSITVYTAQIQAKPIAIGDDTQDALIGFDSSGVMCVRAQSGAIRLEQQLSGQSVIVPQGGDILLPNGALEGLSNTGGHCECEVQLAMTAPPPPEVSRMATPEEIRQRDAVKAAQESAEKDAAVRDASDKAAAEKEATDKAVAERAAAERAAEEKIAERAAAENPASGRAAAERKAAENAPPPPVPWGEQVSPTPRKSTLPKSQEPVYQVFMPPLTFDAKAAAPPDNFDPKFIVMVRRVRVKPTLIFKGTVAGETPVAKQVADVKPAKGGPAAPANGATPQGAKPAAPPADNSVVNRVRNYIRHLFS
jgi:hypothetical protein